MSVRMLPCLVILLHFCAQPHVAWSCDYTVRDIGFVDLGKPAYSVFLIGPAPSTDVDDASKDLKDWRIQLSSVLSGSSVELPKPIGDFTSANNARWSIWLIDSQQRCLRLCDASDEASLPSIRSVIDQQIRTPRMQQLIEGSFRSFAQIVLFDSASTSQAPMADRAARSLKKLEPMLPRPIKLPASVVTIPESERATERVLLWSLGIDHVDSDTAVMSVLYGRGKLAGPAMVGGTITEKNYLGQLALVGESCECETQRGWLEERAIPFYWTDEQSRQAERSLGFNPTKPSVVNDVRAVIARGVRANESSHGGDQIDRIVAGYLESGVEGFEAELVAIPPGRKSNASEAKVTLVSGPGWGFDTPLAQSNPQLGDASESKAPSADTTRPETAAADRKSEAGGMAATLATEEGEIPPVDEKKSDNMAIWIALGAFALCLLLLLSKRAKTTDV